MATSNGALVMSIWPSLISRTIPVCCTKLTDCVPVWPSEGCSWSRYSWNFGVSRLKPGVETFARLFAITSID